MYAKCCQKQCLNVRITSQKRYARRPIQMNTVSPWWTAVVIERVRNYVMPVKQITHLTFASFIKTNKTSACIKKQVASVFWFSSAFSFSPFSVQVKLILVHFWLKISFVKWRSCSLANLPYSKDSGKVAKNGRPSLVHGLVTRIFHQKVQYSRPGRGKTNSINELKGSDDEMQTKGQSDI